MNWYLAVLRKYAVFHGRARRTEYWMFLLFNILIGFVLGILAGIFGGSMLTLPNLYSLAVFIPALAVTVRRLHDTGKTGWWVLIGVVPVIGTIVLIIFLVIDSEPGANEHGPNPKAEMV